MAAVESAVLAVTEVLEVVQQLGYRKVKARDVVEHWSKRGRPRADAERAVNPEQRSLDDLLDR